MLRIGRFDGLEGVLNEYTKRRNYHTNRWKFDFPPKPVDVVWRVFWRKVLNGGSHVLIGGNAFLRFTTTERDKTLASRNGGK